MKKRILVAFITALITLSVSMTTVSAKPLTWKDGALAKYNFTYVSADDGIKKVIAFDKNETYNGEIKKGQTITTKTGTIFFRDSYTNITTFEVDVKSGYELVELSGNVGDAKVTKIGKDKYSFMFTDKGAEAWCFGDDVDFSLRTEKKEYKFVNSLNGEVLSTVRLGEKLSLKESEQYGYRFDGYELNGNIINNDNVLSEELIKNADENNIIKVSPVFTPVNCTLALELYNNNNDGVLSGSFVERKVFDVPFGTKVDSDYLYNVLKVSKDYKIIDEKEITMDINNNNILNLVRQDKAFSLIGSRDYSISFMGKNSNIKSVSYEVDDIKKEIELYETIKFQTHMNILKDKRIKFTVTTNDNKMPTLICDGTDNKIVENNDKTYSFYITVKGYNNDKQAHFDFILK